MSGTSAQWPEEDQPSRAASGVRDPLGRYLSLPNRAALVATADELLADLGVELWATAVTNARLLPSADDLAPPDVKHLATLLLVEVAAIRFLAVSDPTTWAAIEHTCHRAIDGLALVKQILTPRSGTPPAVISALAEIVSTEIRQRNDWAEERRERSSSWRWIFLDRGHPDGRLRDSAAAYVLSEVDLGAALDLLATVRSPRGVGALVHYGPAHPTSRFATWRGLAERAPSAFDSRGRWNGEALLPALLRDAGQALDRPRRRPPGAPSPVSAGSTLLSNVADIVYAREDGPACAWHWAAWLLEQAVRRQDLTAHGRDAPPDPGWRLCQTLLRHERAHEWTRFDSAQDSFSALPLDLLRALAATEADLISGADVARNLLTETAQALLEGMELTTDAGALVTAHSTPNSLGPQLFAKALYAEDVAGLWDDLWEQASIHVEALRHSSTLGFSNLNAVRRIIWLVTAAGTAAVGHLRASERGQSDLDSITALLEVLHDWLTEVLEAETYVVEASFAVVHDHLLVHAFQTESDPREGAVDPTPTLADKMLNSRVDLTQEFVNCLATLFANGITAGRIDRGLSLAGLDVGTLIKEVQRHNRANMQHQLFVDHLLSELRLT